MRKEHIALHIAVVKGRKATDSEGEIDSKTGEEITKSVLNQLLPEE